MDLHLLTTILIFIVLIFAAVRLIRMAFDPEDTQRSILGKPRTGRQPAVVVTPDEDPQPVSEEFTINEGAWKPRRSSGGTVLSLAFLGAIGYLWSQHGSLDQMIKAWSSPASQPAPAAQAQLASDHAVIDGIRWFQLVGTDSAGVGYSGWVSELAFHQQPPEPSHASGTDAILQKLGLPTTADTVKAARQLRKLGEDLKRQNRLNRSN